MSEGNPKRNTNVEAVILAGGKGTRMQGKVPKPMEIVQGKPMLSYGLEILERLNFTNKNIICLIGHRGEIIKAYTGKTVKYAEQRQFTGNMGAVFESLEALNSDTTEVLVIQGDDCLFLDEKELRKMLEEYERLKPAISIMLTKHTERNRVQFIIDSSKRIVKIIDSDTEKRLGLFTNGVYIFSVKAVKDYMGKISGDKEIGIMKFITTSFHENLDVRGFVSEMPWMEVNDRAQLSRAHDSRKS